jgi:lipase
VRVVGQSPAPVRPSSPVAGGRDLTLPGDRIRLAATRWQGSGPPVLLLHGLASSRRFWNLVVPHLVGLPLLALDQRGHGDSEQPDTGYDTPTVVQDALTALDAVGWSRVVVVGHSWGASTALTLAATFPERVLAAVAIDGGLSTPRSTYTREQARTLLAPPRPAVPPDQVPDLFRQGPLGAWWSPAVEDALLPIFGVGPDGLARPRFEFRNHMQVVDALYDYDPDSVWDRITVPTWLLVATPLADAPDHGGREWADAKAEGARRAATRLRSPRVVTIGGGLHDVPLQWPALVAGAVRAAADEVASGPERRGGG